MTKSTFKQKLQHPAALVAQGFVVGALLFWATAPGDSAQATPPAPAAIHATL